MEGINLDQFPDIPKQAHDDLKMKMRGGVQLEDGVQRAVISGHDGGVGYRFFRHQEYNPVKSEDAGYEVFDEIEMIQWLVDRRTKPTERVRFLPEALLRFDRHGEPRSGRYLEAYKRFKAGEDAVGTPLRRWGVLADNLIASLEAEHIFTIEQFAETPEDRVVGRFPEEFVQAWKRAQQWMGSQNVSKQYGEQSQQLAEQAALIAQLQKQLAALSRDGVVTEPEPEPADDNALVADTVRRSLEGKSK